jgi:uncharacterized membrane protein YdbT with pleckstrin-like domain
MAYRNRRLWELLAKLSGIILVAALGKLVVGLPTEIIIVLVIITVIVAYYHASQTPA